MSLAEKITAEFVAQIDEQLGVITDELKLLDARLIDLQGKSEGLHTVRARLLGDVAVLPAPQPQPQPEPQAKPQPREEVAAAPAPEPTAESASQRGNHLGKPWTAAEDEAIRDLWPTERAACYLELSHRTPKAVDMRAYKIGVRAGAKNRPTAAVHAFPKRNPSAPPAEPEHSPEFQRQLERVRAGAPISEKPVIRRADPDYTLGGVTELAS